MRKLVLFTAPAWCPACRMLAKAGSVGKFKTEHPEVPLEVVDLSDKQDAAQQKRADDAEIKAIPQLVLYDAEGKELHRTGSRLGTPAQILKFWSEP